MPPTAPPSHAAKQLAEQFGQLAQGVAANAWLAAVLVALVNLIVQAILAIADRVPAASDPGAAPSRALPAPAQESPARAGAQKSSRRRSVRPQPRRARPARDARAMPPINQRPPNAHRKGRQPRPGGVRQSAAAPRSPPPETGLFET